MTRLQLEMVWFGDQIYTTLTIPSTIPVLCNTGSIVLVIPGNKKADELARNESKEKFLGSECLFRTDEMPAERWREAIKRPS